MFSIAKIQEIKAFGVLEKFFERNLIMCRDYVNMDPTNQETPKTVCQHCNKEYSFSYIRRHERICQKKTAAQRMKFQKKEKLQPSKNSPHKRKRNMYGETDLIIASKKGNVAKIRTILQDSKMEIDVDEEDYNHWTPLHESARNGDYAFFFNFFL